MSSPRAWGWLTHLRAGATPPGLEWEGTAPAGARLPGAQQLELVRRLNLLAPAPTDLADRVLGAGGPGRGHQDLALVGDDRRGFGAAPVDPAVMPTVELVRLASGVLADVVVDRAAPPSPDPRPHLFRRRFLLRGDPWLNRSARLQLSAQGRPPGGRRARGLVVVAPVDDYVADVWAALAADGMVPRWSTWLGRLDDRLPPRADPVLQAERLAARVGRRRVELCLGLDAVAEVLGTELATPPRLSHAALDTLRHVKGVLRVVVGDAGARRLTTTSLVPLLGGDADADLPRPGVPRLRMPWLRAEARRWEQELAGYPVHGGVLADLQSGDPVRTTPPTDDEVLHVMLRALHRSVLGGLGGLGGRVGNE